MCPHQPDPTCRNPLLTSKTRLLALCTLYKKIHTHAITNTNIHSTLMQKCVAHAFGCVPCQTCGFPPLWTHTSCCVICTVCYANRPEVCVCVCVCLWFFFVEVCSWCVKQTARHSRAGGKWDGWHHSRTSRKCWILHVRSKTSEIRIPLFWLFSSANDRADETNFGAVLPSSVCTEVPPEPTYALF